MHFNRVEFQSIYIEKLTNSIVFFNNDIILFFNQNAHFYFKSLVYL